MTWHHFCHLPSSTGKTVTSNWVSQRKGNKLHLLMKGMSKNMHTIVFFFNLSQYLFIILLEGQTILISWVWNISFFIHKKTFSKIIIICSLSVWWEFPLNPCLPVVFYFVNIMILRMLRLFISSWIVFGRSFIFV